MSLTQTVTLVLYFLAINICKKAQRQAGAQPLFLNVTLYELYLSSPLTIC